MTEVECKDKNCPKHGNIKVRGNIFRAKVVSTGKMNGSVVVERDFIRKVNKYDRMEKRRSRMIVHKPGCINVKPGDIVRVGETKKISKTKSFVIIDVIKRGE